MQEQAYAVIRDHQTDHWWFRGRARIVEKVLLAGLKTPVGRILDLGAGFGGMIPLLKPLGEVEALEPYQAAQAALLATGAQVHIAPVEDFLRDQPERFDLVTLFDVLEHIEDDDQAVELVHRALRPGGRLILTVPAMPSLWSAHDELHRHYRRYTKKGLGALLAGRFEIERLSYYNSLLWPLAALERWLTRRTADQRTEVERSSGLLNGLLYRVFIAEIPLLKLRFPFPCGVSLLASCTRE